MEISKRGGDPVMELFKEILNGRDMELFVEVLNRVGYGMKDF